MPNPEILKAIEEMEAAKAQPKKRGRPKGSKDKVPRARPSEKPGEKSNLSRINNVLVDPKTGIAVQNRNKTAVTIQHMGDERVSAFVQYHIDMLQMRQGVNKKDVPDLYNRFYIYLAYCVEHGVIPNNMNAYFAIGIDKSDIGAWSHGRGTPEQQRFAADVKQFFASIHEQAGGEGIVNPILSIYWSKAHDGMIEASKVEVVNSDPLGEKQSAEQIAEKYAGLLPEDA